jgi:DUF917 family protein
MPRRRLTTRQDIHEFVMGTDFLSASGGGSPEDTLRLLEDDLTRQVPLSWIDLAELPDDALVVTANFSGSIAPVEDRADMEHHFGVSPVLERPLVQAVQELETLLGRTVDALIPLEIGGINAGHALDTAANLGLPLIDADYAGRAIPESTCITPNLFGKPIYPRVYVDFYGDVLHLKTAQANRVVERLGKFISMASLGMVGVASIPLSGRDVKEIAIPGTLTESLQIGHTIHRARAEGRDPVASVVEELRNTWLLFRGHIVSRRWESRDGYMWGEHEIEGENAFAGRRLRVWFKNENHVTWLDDIPYVCSPDIIEVLKGETAEPLVNSSVTQGQRVAVVGVRRREPFNNVSGIALLGPQHWGFDLEYRPIEELVAV